MLQILEQRSPDSRTQVRSNVFLGAALECAERSFPVRIRNISRSGALLDGKELPGEGDSVRLRRAGLLIGGKVAWRVSGFLGMCFAEDIEVDQWARRVGHRGQQRVDELIAAVRGQPCGGSGEALDRKDDEDTIASVSADLVRVSECLADALRMSDHVGNELLRLDAIAHRLRLIVARTTAKD